MKEKKDFKDCLINLLLAGLIATNMVWCVCYLVGTNLIIGKTTELIGGMWDSYFEAEYEYPSQNISNVNTTSINEVE
jgi:hypothetical protein